MDFKFGFINKIVNAYLDFSARMAAKATIAMWDMEERQEELRRAALAHR